MEFKDLSENLLTCGYGVRTNARGVSMLPLIWTGDMITISSKKNMIPKDIIVFKRESQMVCHAIVRVFEKNGIKYYQSRGNSFFGLDEPVTSEQILGKVTRIERGSMPFLKKISLFMSPVLRVGRLNAIVISRMVRGLKKKGSDKAAPMKAEEKKGERPYKRPIRKIDTSLDSTDNNEKWNSQTIRPDVDALRKSTVSPLPGSPLPFQALKDGGTYKNMEGKMNQDVFLAVNAQCSGHNGQ